MKLKWQLCHAPLNSSTLELKVWHILESNRETEYQLFHPVHISFQLTTLVEAEPSKVTTFGYWRSCNLRSISLGLT